MGLGQVVKPQRSNPGHSVPAAPAKPAGLSNPKLPTHPVRCPRALSPVATGRMLALSRLIGNQLLGKPLPFLLCRLRLVHTCI